MAGTRVVKMSELTKDNYKVGDIAVLLGVTTQSVRNYANAGDLVANKSNGGVRSFSKEAVIEFLGKNNKLVDDNGGNDSNNVIPNQFDVVYARVSPNVANAAESLQRQVKHVTDVYELENVMVVTDVADGVYVAGEYHQGLWSIIQLWMCNKLGNLYVEREHIIGSPEVYAFFSDMLRLNKCHIYTLEDMYKKGN